MYGLLELRALLLLDAGLLLLRVREALSGRLRHRRLGFAEGLARSQHLLTDDLGEVTEYQRLRDHVGTPLAECLTALALPLDAADVVPQVPGDTEDLRRRSGQGVAGARQFFRPGGRDHRVEGVQGLPLELSCHVFALPR
ncbi:hypothetical protein BKD26_35540 [Streptomyces sp. CB03238]|nr:hypothetical protein BKD26_35540 [Streptomyces sp. CB03238]